MKSTPIYWSRDQINVLIDAYEGAEELYNASSPFYMNKWKRKEGLSKLLAAVKPVMPKCTEDAIRAKIRSMRSMYVAERNRIELSMKSGCGADEVYKPALWYYPRLKFLENHVKRKTNNLDGRAMGLLHVKKDTSSEISGESSMSRLSDFESLSFSSPLSPTEDPLQLEPEPSPARLSPVHNVQKTTRGTKRLHDDAYERAVDLFNKMKELKPKYASEDQPEIFGRYVASVLRGITNPIRYSEAKRRMADVLAEIEREEALEKYTK